MVICHSSLKYVLLFLYMRRLVFLGFVFAFLFGLFMTPVLSAKPTDIPEEDGIYDEPGHPGVKVRVFVHRERPAKPSTPPTTVCKDDLDSNSFVHKEAWKLPLTWTYNLNPSSVPASVGSGDLQIIAENGFNGWESASGNKVNFIEGPTTTVSRQAYDYVNVVTWGRTSGSALGVTYIRYNSTGAVLDVDTIMNTKIAWSWSNSNTCGLSSTYDAEDIMTHELGHWLGLTDEYDAASYQNATMYGYGAKGEVKKVTLTTGDSAGAFAIYNP